MSNSHRYPHDVFISYARRDDRTPNGAPGWVSTFRDRLANLLSRRLGRDVDIWRDVDAIDNNQRFTETIRRGIESSAVLIALISRSSLASTYCKQERAAFAAQRDLIANPSSGDDRSRIMGVFVDDIPKEQWPPEIQGMVGFHFHDKDGFPLDPGEPAYQRELKPLVLAIEATLEAMRREALTDLGKTLQSDQVRQRFHALGPEAGMELRRYREQIEAQIDLMGDLKEMHDQLHKILIESYNPVEALVHQCSFPPPEEELELEASQSSLEFALEALRDVVRRQPRLGGDASWIEPLAKADESFKQALQAREQAGIRGAFRRIKLFLDTQPSRINTRLTQEAREIHLSNFIQALRRVIADLEGSGFDPDQLERMVRGLTALEEINDGVADLIDKHNTWQILDDELRRIESNIDLDYEELISSWQDLKYYGGKLYGQDEAGWPSQLKSLGDALEGEAREVDPELVGRRFQGFRAYARQRFDRTDQDLKSRCMTARRIASEVRELLPIEL